MRLSHVVLAMLALAGCGQPPTGNDGDMLPGVANQSAPAADAARGPASGRAPADGTAEPLPTDSWLGRWTGPEGLFVDIAPAGERGRYAMMIKGDLDSAGDRVTGVADGDTIRFVRGTIAETLRATDGDGTGLKWLAGRKDCLVVKPGEGYCRD